MYWIIDIDGVITSNPAFFVWWTYLLKKSGHKVDILTARKDFGLSELKKWNISYDRVYVMQPHSSDWSKQAVWKIKKIKELKPDLWVDNDFKMWERVFKMDLDELIPNVARIRI